MTGITVTAPGKLILCGEYAVLRNAPAVVMAVDRRAVVRITPHDEAHHTLTTPGLHDGTWRFEIDDRRPIRWLDEPPAPVRALPEAVFAQRGIEAGTPAHIDIDTAAFADPATNSKLGLGSSAAACVALVKALLGTGVDATWQTARAAHADMVGGSGADIAASCFGGLLCYRQDEPSALAGLEWPDGLECRVFWSGVAASTGNAIRAYSSDAVSDARWLALQNAAGEAAAAWAHGDAAEILNAVRRNRDALYEFDRSGPGHIFSAGHADLAELGDDLDIVYKPSGAGGGDCGVAIADDSDRLDRFSSEAVSRGFVSLDVRRDNRGV